MRDDVTARKKIMKNSMNALERTEIRKDDYIREDDNVQEYRDGRVGWERDEKMRAHMAGQESTWK